MRVIAGKWRSRRLRATAGQDVRPTSDRVKEALFNIVASDLEGALFLDLCCGCGGLGIEALSRGAARAVFVDQAPAALAMVEANLATCGAATGSFSLVRAEAVAWLRRWQPPSSDGSWLVVADPPYQSSDAAAILVEAGRLSGHPGFRACVVEHGVQSPDLAGHLPGAKTRRYGSSLLTLLRIDAPHRG